VLHFFRSRSLITKTNEAITKKRETMAVKTGVEVSNFLSSHLPSNTPIMMAARNWNANPEYLK